jgi:hypothetical protein
MSSTYDFPSDNGPCENTDTELWRGPDEGCGDFYADSLHMTKEGALGINCGGRVIVKPIREWHLLASLEVVCGACGQPWQEGMSCAQKENEHPFPVCYAHTHR